MSETSSSISNNNNSVNSSPSQLHQQLLLQRLTTKLDGPFRNLRLTPERQKRFEKQQQHYSTLKRKRNIQLVHLWRCFVLHVIQISLIQSRLLPNKARYLKRHATPAQHQARLVAVWRQAFPPANRRLPRHTIGPESTEKDRRWCTTYLDMAKWRQWSSPRK